MNRWVGVDVGRTKLPRLGSLKPFVLPRKSTRIIGNMANAPKSSAFLKLERAFEIRDELRDLLEELLSAPREISRRDNNEERASPTVWVEWILDSIPDYTRAALLLGDVIHNLRAAMDHVIWAVTPRMYKMRAPPMFPSRFMRAK